MYDYTDATAGSGSSFSLPAEAVSIDGKYIDEINGHGYSYATLYTTGREALSQEIDLGETKNNGAIYKGRRYPERTIIVGIQILADDAECARTAWNRLAGLLNKDEVELIFADEPDKYFKAHPGNIEPPEKGRLNGTAELEFICTDPFKYDADTVSIIPLTTEEKYITVGGTVPVYPEITATSPGYCNYIKIRNLETGKDLTFGNETAESFMTGVLTENNSFVTVPSIFAGNPQSAWTFDGHNFSNNKYTALRTYDDYQWRGYKNNGDVVSNTGVMFSGSFTAAKNWHTVGSLRLQEPTDTFARYNHMTWLFYRLTDANGDDILTIRFSQYQDYVTFRAYKYGTKIEIPTPVYRYPLQTGMNEFIVRTKRTDDTIKIYIGYMWGGEEVKWGETTLTSCGNVPKLARVHYHFYLSTIQQDTVANQPLIGFGKDHYIFTTDDDLETNTFVPGDILTCDCKTGEILLNGIDGAEYGDIRNDWENFSLSPSSNNIIAMEYDENATDTPTASLKYIRGWI